MFHSTRFGLVTLLVLGAACQPAPKTETAALGAEIPAVPAGLSAEDEAAIRAVDAEWARAATAGDAEAVAALYASDATVLPPMQPMLQGDAAKRYWIDFTNGVTGPTELTTTAVDGRGDLAVAVGTYRATLTPKKAGAKPLPTDQGKYLEVLKKQADGSWKIVYDIWNADAPAAKQ
ncbi:MAG TPA: SgcJ/EcaC family oxidoreductase [Gemmatimonadales bacterium]|nr:SgcJ/EcaC family oxidoreductase [Gemmatimonadales bacterium]